MEEEEEEEKEEEEEGEEEEQEQERRGEDKEQKKWQLTPVIPALWEAKAEGSQGHEFETSLTNMVKPRLY